MDPRVKLLGWKIVYKNTLICKSSDYKWEDAPSTNVVAIFYYQDFGNGQMGMSKVVGRDFYDFDGHKFYKSDDRKSLPNIAIKEGAYLPDPQYFSLISNLKKEDITKWVLVRL